MCHDAIHRRVEEEARRTTRCEGAGSERTPSVPSAHRPLQRLDRGAEVQAHGAQVVTASASNATMHDAIAASASTPGLLRFFAQFCHEHLLADADQRSMPPRRTVMAK